MHYFGVHNCHLGHLDKITVFNQIANSANLAPEAIAYIGDDLPDLPCIQAAGLGVSVPNAVKKVRDHADWITPRPGGHGAFRDVVDLLMTYGK